MSEKKGKKGISTDIPKVEDFIGGAKADQVGKKDMASTETRGRPAAEEPMKIQNFYLPISLIGLIQKMADKETGGNKSQFGRKVFEDLARKQGLLK